MIVITYLEPWGASASCRPRLPLLSKAENDTVRHYWDSSVLDVLQNGMNRRNHKEFYNHMKTHPWAIYALSTYKSCDAWRALHKYFKIGNLSSDQWTENDTVTAHWLMFGFFFLQENKVQNSSQKISQSNSMGSTNIYWLPVSNGLIYLIHILNCAYVLLNVHYSLKTHARGSGQAD